MRRIAVMAGPSLSVKDRASYRDCHWLPPAAAGDVVALLDDPPEILCLIDGLFDARPAPWHKELMLLIARGTAVLGASRMGALRAAELDRHGMIGVGAIYAAYRDGRLTGDDEVALIHATERLDYAPLSVPLVEVRATLVAACRAGLMEAGQARRLRAAAMELYFSDRDWPALRNRWVSEQLCDERTAAELESLHVPLKRLDALTCLEAAQRTVPAHPPPEPPITYFVMQLLGQLPA
jgi:hypothetical protein